MIGTLSTPDQFLVLLRRWKRMVAIRQDVMSSMYDLDGALAAGQWGMVALASRGLVNLTVLTVLLERGADVPAFARREREWRLAIDALETISPELAEEAWRLYLAPVGENDDARAHCRAVLRFLGQCHSGGPTLSLSEALAAWAESARTFGTICAELGIPTADDWYLLPGTGSDDWYREVLRHLEDGR